MQISHTDNVRVMKLYCSSNWWNYHIIFHMHFCFNIRKLLLSFQHGDPNMYFHYWSCHVNPLTNGVICEQGIRIIDSNERTPNATFNVKVTINLGDSFVTIKLKHFLKVRTMSENIMVYAVSKRSFNPAFYITPSKVFVKGQNSSTRLYMTTLSNVRILGFVGI